MNQGIAGKFRNKFLGVGLAGIVGLGLAGCVQPPKNGQYYTNEEIRQQENDAAMLNAGGLVFGLAGVAAPTPARAASFGVLSQASHAAATNNAIGAAGKYAGNAQVYENRQHQGEQLSQSQVTFSSCNQWVDLNGDGQLTENELMNKKDIFNLNESIALGAHWIKCRGKISARLFRVSDNLTLHNLQFGDIDPPSKLGWYSGVTLTRPNWDTGNMKSIDEYAIEWSLNDQLVGKHYFIVKK